VKTVLITGSEGFVGQHLWRELESNGYRVVGTSLNQSAESKEHQVYTCNILEVDSIKKIIEEVKADVIFHLAAQAKTGLSFDQPQETIKINTLGTLNLLESVRAQGDSYRPRIFIIGTAEEYGKASQENLPVTEGSAFQPLNPYAVSKLSNWYLSQIYVKSFGFDIIYPTPFNHTGPGQLPGFLAPDIASQIVEIEKTGTEGVLVTGNLDAARDITDVRDVVRAYRLLVDRGVSGERYVICSGQPIPVTNVVNKLISLSKVKINHTIDPNKIRPTDNPILYGSFEKLNQTTDWKPEIPLDKTLSDLLDWYRTR